jgi:predicted dinucleotide-binding enzyme
MKFAVIGAGNVGRAIGDAWTRIGHEVVYGVPDPRDPKYASVPSGYVKRPDQAASKADIIALATPWNATEAACRSIGDLKGKMIIDCTNPATMGPDGLGLALGFSTSGGEMVQSWCPGAFVFKTLNQVGFEVLADTSKLFPTPAMFVAGDDASKKPTVLKAVHDLGFEAVDAGPLNVARLLEPYAMLWINLALKHGLPRNCAFSLVRPAASH